MAAVISEQKKVDPLGASNAATKPAASCTECQRRKQKCSKEWPCNHCQSRRVAHLCHFPPKSAVAGNATKKEAQGSAKRKGSSDASSQYTPPDLTDVPEDGINDDMADLGYMPGTDRFNVPHATTVKPLHGHERKPSPVRQDQITARPTEIPSRSLTDTLIHNYLNHFNYHYFCTYPPAFLEEYVEWWSRVAAGKPISKSFTALLLRILACSVQFLPEPAQRSVEFELAENAQSLTERFFAAAETLSQQTGPGQGGLDQVEQLFLAACWLKAEARFVESWHALGTAIREAQEQGLHRETISNSVEPQEWIHALRRRVWCILYVWDFYMAGWLGRPLIIDHSSCHIDTNLLRIDQASTGPDPFAHVTIQCDLIQIVSKLFAKFGGKPTSSDLIKLQRKIDEWRQKLPVFLRLEDEDKSFDTEHPFVQHQRLQLHATVMMMRLSPLKPYLVQPVDPAATLEDDQLREEAVQHCLNLLSVTKRLYDLGVDPKDHLVIFCLFDTAATACSAIIHGVGKIVGREQELRDAVDTTLFRLAELAERSKPGAMSYRILSRLWRRLPPLGAQTLLPDTKSTKRVKTTSTSTAVPPTLVSDETADSSSDVTRAASVAQTNSPEDPLPWISPNEFDPNNFVPQQWEVDGDFSGFDYAGLEQVWNWQNLNLDPFNANPL